MLSVFYLRHIAACAALLYVLLCDVHYSLAQAPSSFLNTEAWAKSGITGQSVDKMTGRLQLSIPVYTIRLGNISVPISIDYIGGNGIKINDVAADVGMGWSINTGGSIVRSVEGEPDERKGSYLDEKRDIFFITTPSVACKAAFTDVIKLSSLPYNEEPSFQVIKNSASYNDIKLAFNAPSHLGGNIPSNIITPTTPEITDLIVIDRLQNYFYFTGEKSVSRFSTYIISPEGEDYVEKLDYKSYIASWQLQKVSSIDGNITYHYDTLYTGQTLGYQNEIREYTSSSDIPGDFPWVLSYPLRSGESRIYNKTLRIKSIHFPYGKIKFSYNENERADFRGRYALKKITIEDQLGNIIKTMLFEYSYFITNTISGTIPSQVVHEDSVTTGSSNNNFESSVNSNLLKRLYLNAVRIQDGYSNEANNGYKLTYYNLGSPQSWIAYPSGDYWGYFNGNKAAAQYGPSPRPPGSDTLYITNDAYEPDDCGMQGLIRTVTFPEGLEKSFEYVRILGDYLIPPNKDYPIPYIRKNNVIGGFLLSGVTDTDPVTNTILNSKNYVFRGGIGLQSPDWFKILNVPAPKNYSDFENDFCNITHRFAVMYNSREPGLNNYLSPTYCFDSLTEYDNVKQTATIYNFNNYNMDSVAYFFRDNYSFDAYNRQFYYSNYKYNGYFTQFGEVEDFRDDIIARFANNPEIGMIKTIKTYKNYMGPLQSAEYFLYPVDPELEDSILSYRKTYRKESGLCNNSQPQELSKYYTLRGVSPFAMTRLKSLFRENTEHFLQYDTRYYPSSTVPYSSIDMSFSDYQNRFNITTPAFRYETIEDVTIGYYGVISGTFYKREFGNKIRYVLALVTDTLIPVENFKFSTADEAGLREPPIEMDPNAPNDLSNNWLYPTPDIRYTDTLLVNRWDDVHNLLLESKAKGGIKEVYIYGYASFDTILPVSIPPGVKKILVAKITGDLSYEYAQSFINQNLLDSALYYSDAVIRNELNKLRINLPEAFVETYTYKPLIGITSSTDARGRTSYYSYDSYGRLSTVKDVEGNVIEQKEYRQYGLQ